MPCRSGYEDERIQFVKDPQIIAELDRLTKENDMLREAVLGLTRDENYTLKDSVVKLIEKDQIAHRKEDLARLKKDIPKLIKDSKQSHLYEALGKVYLADPNFPLEPQLGFDPDEY